MYLPRYTGEREKQRNQQGFSNEEWLIWPRRARPLPSTQFSPGFASKDNTGSASGDDGAPASPQPPRVLLPAAENGSVCSTCSRRCGTACCSQSQQMPGPGEAAIHPLTALLGAPESWEVQVPKRSLPENRAGLPAAVPQLPAAHGLEQEHRWVVSGLCPWQTPWHNFCECSQQSLHAVGADSAQLGLEALGEASWPDLRRSGLLREPPGGWWREERCGLASLKCGGSLPRCSVTRARAQRGVGSSSSP